MKFPQYNYKDFNNENKSEWALQPPTISNWCKMVNDADEYCKTITDIKDFDGKCKDWELPSKHPYWLDKVKERDLAHISSIKARIFEANELIKRNPNHTYIGNMYTSIKRMELLLK